MRSPKSGSSQRISSAVPVGRSRSIALRNVAGSDSWPTSTNSNRSFATFISAHPAPSRRPSSLRHDSTPRRNHHGRQPALGSRAWLTGGVWLSPWRYGVAADLARGAPCADSNRNGLRLFRGELEPPILRNRPIDDTVHAGGAWRASRAGK